MRLELAALVVATLVPLPGCGYAVFQTAHTEPVGKAAVALGAATTFNEFDDEANRNARTNAVGEATVRVGLTDHVDVGMGPYLFPGWQGDVKVNVFDRKSPLAVASRAGLGYSSYDGDETFLAFAGAIGSYRVERWFEPYLALTLTDQWIHLSDPPEVELGPNEELAARHHTGNGMLRTTLGLHLATSPRFAFVAEYGHWAPLWNDPGDSYRLLQNHLVAIGIRFSGREREPKQLPARDDSAATN